MYEFHQTRMPRKVLTEPIKRLTVKLPESEYEALENSCRKRQETKRQVIRSFKSTLKSKQYWSRAT